MHLFYKIQRIFINILIIHIRLEQSNQFYEESLYRYLRFLKNADLKIKEYSLLETFTITFILLFFVVSEKNYTFAFEYKNQNHANISKKDYSRYIK